MGLERDAGAAHRVAPLAADGDHAQVSGRLGDLACREPDRVRVQRAGQAAIGRDQDDQPPAALAPDEERMVLAAEHGRDRSARTSSSFSAYGRDCEGRLLGALELRGGDELHRPGDLLDVPGRLDPSAGCRAGWPRLGCFLPALRQEALAECRRSPSSSAFAISSASGSSSAELLEDGGPLGLEEAVEAALELPDARRRDVVELALRGRVQDRDLLLDRRAAGTAAAW